jgi:hypothetical protein
MEETDEGEDDDFMNVGVGSRQAAKRQKTDTCRYAFLHH